MSDYQFNQKTMKSLHERIEELENKANCQAKEVAAIEGALAELVAAINCINTRLSLVSRAARELGKEMTNETL